MNPNKPKIPLVDFPFIAEMAKVLEAGLANKPERERDDWKRLKWTKEIKFEYECSLWRHYGNYKSAESPSEARKHLAALAVNAMILSHYEDGGVFHSEEKPLSIPQECLDSFMMTSLHGRIPNPNLNAPHGFLRNKETSIYWHYYENSFTSLCGENTLYPEEEHHWEYYGLVDRPNTYVCPKCASINNKQKGGTKNDERK